MARAVAVSRSDMSEQGGDPSFRVNRWDVLTVLFNTTTALFGVIAGMFQAFGHLSRGYSGFQDDKRDFQEQASLSIETIAGEGNGR